MRRRVAAGARDRLPGSEDVNCGDQIICRAILEQESARAGGERLIDECVLVEGREDESPRRTADVSNQPCGRSDSVHHRHPNVHEHHVGPHPSSRSLTLQLTIEKGLANVTTDDIARVAFVSPRHGDELSTAAYSPLPPIGSIRRAPGTLDGGTASSIG